MAKGRTYRLEAGVQDLIGLALDQRLEKRVADWKAGVEAGVIDEEARSVFVALGWITSRDTRVVPVAREPRAKDAKAASEG